MQTTEESTRWNWLLRRRLQAGLVLVPGLIAYLLLGWLFTPIPMIDDYWHLFAFALAFQGSPSVAAKIDLLLNSQVGPYKLIFDHSIVAWQLLAIGHLNFPAMIWVGNLTLLGLLALYWKHTLVEGAMKPWRVLLVLPVSLLLFSMNYAETVNWAISGLQQPMVILFSLAALHFLVNRAGSARSVAAACGFSVLACMTYANGMLVWPVGLLMLLVQDRRWGRVAGWCAAGLATSAFYLHHYVSDGMSASNSIGSKLVFLAMFCGGGLENMHHRPVPYLSLVLGVGMLGVFLHAVSTGYGRRNPFIFWGTVWLLATGAVVANARIAMGMQLSLSSRYKIYCDLLFIFCYEYLLDRLFFTGLLKARPREAMRWLAIAGVAALVMNIGGDIAGARFLQTRRMRSEAAMRRYVEHPESGSPMFLVEDVLSPEEILQEEKARVELTEAIRMKIYTPPGL